MIVSPSFRLLLLITLHVHWVRLFFRLRDALPWVVLLCMCDSFPTSWAASVAQLVEYLSSTQYVAGFSPAWGSIFFENNCLGCVVLYCLVSLVVWLFHVRVHVCTCKLKYLRWPGKDVFSFDVELHRPKKARGNEKDKPPSGVEPRSNDQQTSTPDTEPQSPDKFVPSFPLITYIFARSTKIF